MPSESLNLTSSNAFEIVSSGDITTNSTLPLSPSSDATIPLTLNSLQKLPSEIRRMIFQLTSVPSGVLVAFRGDQRLYTEALEVHYDTEYFNLPRRFNVKKCKLSQSSLNSIERVKLNQE